jgi:hypothetical protein
VGIRHKMCVLEEINVIYYIGIRFCLIILFKDIVP